MNLKKFLAGVLACCVVGGALPSVEWTADKAVITANAEATVPSNLTLVGKGSEGDFSCNYYSDGSLLIDGYDGKESVVTIPESINGKKVRSFLVDFYYFGITITDVYVPSSVALLGNNTTYKVDEAIEKMKSNGITLHIVGDIPDTPEPEKVPYAYKKLYDGTIEITGWDKSATEAVIPSKIDGMAVTSIGGMAFSGCTGLTKITIPDSVTSIGGMAFSGCTGLTEITIPESVTRIENETFYNCKSLTKITIPDSVTSIDGSAFYATPWLKFKQEENPLVVVNGILIDGKTCSGEVVISDNVTSIGAGSFSGCAGLTKITIPNSVTSIGIAAFYKCENLTDIIIPDSVTSIKYNAFFMCRNLKKITIPDSVTSIEDHVFQYCTGLTEFTINNNVTNIGVQAFAFTNLTEITIPNSVTSICSNAFEYCEGLIKITILNPNCEIYDSERTISNVSGHDVFGNNSFYFNGTIYGYENSTSQAYAEKYGRKFVSLGETPESIMGDCNNDGAFNVSDIVLLQKWLLAIPDTHLDNWKAADFCKDGKLDVFDLCLMKRELLNK